LRQQKLVDWDDAFDEWIARLYAQLRQVVWNRLANCATPFRGWMWFETDPRTGHRRPTGESIDQGQEAWAKTFATLTLGQLEELATSPMPRAAGSDEASATVQGLFEGSRRTKRTPGRPPVEDNRDRVADFLNRAGKADELHDTSNHTYDQVAGMDGVMLTPRELRYWRRINRSSGGNIDEACRILRDERLRRMARAKRRKTPGT
jgi:hypothetical protein